VHNGGNLASSGTMGVRVVGKALKQARGRLSQRAAADRWGVPVATLAALEQGLDRNYQSQTLAQFDEMLGRSTLDLYLQSDDDSFTLLEIKREIDDLRDELHTHLRKAHGEGDELVTLASGLSAGKRQIVIDLIRSLANAD
jgi:hypothetical protein